MTIQKQKQHLCPKCKKRYMAKNGFKKSRQVWACVDQTGGQKKVCYETYDPTKPCRATGGKPAKPVAPRKKFRRKIDTGRMMVFTAAQNATPAHEGFFATLQSFEKHNSAELCVIPIRYKNPSSIWSDSQKDAEHWLHDVVSASG